VHGETSEQREHHVSWDEEHIKVEDSVLDKKEHLGQVEDDKQEKLVRTSPQHLAHSHQAQRHAKIAEACAR
jgi:hypothetical protein